MSGAHFETENVMSGREYETFREKLARPDRGACDRMVRWMLRRVFRRSLARDASFAAGGIVTGPTCTPLRLAEDECVLDRDLRCVRPAHHHSP